MTDSQKSSSGIYAINKQLDVSFLFKQLEKSRERNFLMEY